LTGDTTVMVDELVRRNAEQPRPDAGLSPPVAVKTPECLFERRRRDIFGNRLGARPAIGIGVDALDITTVELGKSVRVPTRQFDELTLVELAMQRKGWRSHGLCCSRDYRPMSFNAIRLDAAHTSNRLGHRHVTDRVINLRPAR
jgi:hypothetical protein